MCICRCKQLKCWQWRGIFSACLCVLTSTPSVEAYFADAIIWLKKRRQKMWIHSSPVCCIVNYSMKDMEKWLNKNECWKAYFVETTFSAWMKNWEFWHQLESSKTHIKSLLIERWAKTRFVEISEKFMNNIISQCFMA